VTTIAGQIESIYRGITLASGVVCASERGEGPRFAPQGPMGAWYMGVVIAPWWFDHVA
jgi:hypothetical protein